MALNLTPQPLYPTNPLNKPAGQLGSNILSGIGNFASGLYNDVKSLASIAPTPNNNGGGSIQYTSGGVPVLKQGGQNYSPAPQPTNPAATAPVATTTKPSSLSSPAATQYIQSQVNGGVNQPTTGTPGMYSATTGLTANGLTPAQVSQGYSTVQGNFNPVTGLPNTPTSPSGSPTSTATGTSTQSTTTPATDPNNAVFQQYLQSLQSDNSALAQFNNQEKVTQANIGAQPILSQFATGQQAVQQAAAQGEQQNLEQNITNDQTGISNIIGEQGIGVQQQQNANTLALGLKPTVAQYGQTVFNPATGQFSNGGNVTLSGQPATDTTSLATAVANGSIDYQTAFSQLSSAYGGAVANQLLGTIQKNDPSFNVNSSIGQGAAVQSNASTVGSASTAANAQGYAAAMQNYSNLQTAQRTATNLSSQVASAIQNVGLNLTNSTDANAIISSLQSRLGNAAYTQLATAINDANSQYQSILASSGVTPTSAGGQAEQNLNLNMTPSEIISALNQLNTGVTSKVGPAYQQLQDYANQLNGGGTSTSGGVNYNF